MDNYGENVIKENEDRYDYCYRTGDYEDQFCEFCPHKCECSGYEGDLYD